ncbi:hypothetical protein [Muricoccus radiodurans]|uniref:hypothetical protein n=1 Tax=Muricoccus radiodurans TaxID=2231721 RepID=UPI003CE8F98D
MHGPIPPGALAGRRVLLAYGLFGEVIAALRPLGAEYMHAHVDWLRAAGADVSVVRCPTTAPIARNAVRIRDALLADPRPAILIGHSKGGLEALAALLEDRAAAHCAALVALQSPFAGSPVADVVCARRALHRTAGTILRLIRGNGEGIRDLTTASRTAWNATHVTEVAALIARIPVVCVATRVEEAGAYRPRPRHRLLARWLERRGAGPNDGLVPVSSALLPGARHIVLAGDHIAAAARGPGRDPEGILRRALAAVLDPAAQEA